jgi:hypothetical protein
MTAKKDKKDDKIVILWIVSIAAILLLAYALFTNSSGGGINLGSNGGSNGGGISPTPEKVNNAYDVRLSIQPSVICFGDRVTGSVTSNVPNGRCAAFYNNGAGYHVLTEFNLINGGYTYSQQVNALGSVTLIVVCCDENDVCKVSNQAYLRVNSCNTTTTTIPPTRYNCTDSDGGINFATLGNCQDSYHMAGFMDMCDTGRNQWVEYYCDTNGVCQTVNGGACTYTTPCSAVYLPNSQTDCDRGYCPTGICIYHPATISIASRCSC